MTRLPFRLVLSCSSTKRPVDPAAFVPFAELYDGPIWRQVRAAGVDLGQVAAISALYGFLEPGAEIRTYDRKLDGHRAAELVHTSDHVSRLARFAAGAARCYLFGGADYRAVGSAALAYRPGLALELVAGSYLAQRRRLGELLRQAQGVSP